MDSHVATRAEPRRVEGVLAPLRAFVHTEASGGILLLAAALVALAWANSPLGDSYAAVWQTRLGFSFGDIGLAKPLQLWINDGLMAIFFFVVGLEIKREVLIGELASLRRAVLPMAAAVGGALLPAAIFVVFTLGTPASAGWGVPMATDIAFALGVLAVLGPRVPIALKVFVTAVAIVDDLLAILVITFFYAGDVSLGALAAAAGIGLVLVAVNRLDVRRHLVYGVLGIALWIAILSSGIHATVAGVLLAMAVPASTRIDRARFTSRVRGLIDDFAEDDHSDDVRRSGHRQVAVSELEAATDAIQAPLQRLEERLHPWVAYMIVPLFALANAGVSLGERAGQAVSSPLAQGVFVGLVVGKQLGILGAVWVLVKGGFADLPERVRWRHVWGAGWVAGIGFTMSLFVGDLAFTDPAILDVTKVAILTASLVAGLGAWVVLRGTADRPQPAVNE
ncbi:MAG: Na+/H+ antiporter NhaA [Chloroflexota bacterium]|nr:Na+/H+ antiporter NhaA [Chloroflexota bacterium]